MKPVIQIAWVFFDRPLDAATFDFYCAQLPANEQERLRSFRRWEDATASLIGKMLLIKLLAPLNLNLKLADMQHSEDNRPFFNDSVDFNITHSGNCVACAVAQGVKVGIDVEQVREIRLSDFEQVLSYKEMRLVEQSSAKNQAFYQIWTQKEAIVKADGCGLVVDLNEIDTTVPPVNLNGRLWHVKQVEVSANYVMSIAFNNPAAQIEQIAIDLF